jgi:trimethylamine:corrinoid methyltransferase-like protein
VIDAVGPGGSFMIADHALDHLRSEYYMGNGISDQTNRELWETDWALDARARGRQIAKKILAEEPKSYISQDLDLAIRKEFNILLP